MSARNRQVKVERERWSCVLVVQRIKQLHLCSVLDIVAERNSSLRKQQRWRRAARGAYFVLMESKEKEGDRWPCGRSVEYHPGLLQRRYRVPSICSFGYAARIATPAWVFASPSSMSGRGGIIRSRGWSGWWWRGSDAPLNTGNRNFPPKAAGQQRAHYDRLYRSLQRSVCLLPGQ